MSIFGSTFCSSPGNTLTLSNHPNKDSISEFISKCTSSAEESLLPNLFDWKSNSCWISKSLKKFVRIQNDFLALVHFIRTS